jgi:hypothetical protein
MPENDVVVDEPLDAEDWEIALAPYEGNPGAALTLGFHFMILKSYLSVEPLKIQDAIKAIDRAVEVLFPMTQFHEVCEELFRKVIERKLTFEEDQMLRAIGIEF